MATFAPVSPQQTTTRQDAFIPELWSDEIIATYESNLVLANQVRKMSMKGKKGDTINIPKPGRSEAAAKIAETAVTLQEDTADNLVILVDKHYEYSMMIEDIADVQSLPSSRRFYTEDAGYALAKRVDTHLFELGTGFGDGVIDSAPGTPANWVHSNVIQGLSSGVGYREWAEDDSVAGTHALTDAAIRKGMALLDDADVPMTGRSMTICPNAAMEIRGIDRYNSVDFVNNKGVANGQIGALYGVDVFTSSNVPVIETAAQNGGGSGVSRGNFLIHKDALCLTEQVGVRSQTQYKQEFLSTLFTADRLYATDVYRPEGGVVIATVE